MLYYTLFVMIPSILPHINTNKGEVKPHKPQHHRATEHIDQREGGRSLVLGFSVNSTGAT